MRIARGKSSGVTAFLSVLILSAVGCHSCPAPSSHAAAPTTRPTEYLKRPAIDLTRGGVGFPLATTIPPKGAGAIRRALVQGYAKRLIGLDATRIAVEPGARAGHIKSVAIDLTGDTVRPDFVPKNPPKDAKPVAWLDVQSLHYVADPLHYEKYSAGMELQADRATMFMVPADNESLMLNLFDCRTGRVKFDLSVDALKQSLSQGVNIKRSAAFMIDSIDLDLASDNPRALAVDATVHARVLFVPATFRITGRVDVDDKFFVHFSNLLAKGRNPAGMLVAEIVQSKLDLVNDKAAPLLRMPGNKIRVTDLAITLDDVLTVDMAVAGTR